MKNIIIAVDGPAGAGKSTIAKIIAKKLNITLAGFVRGERMNIYTNPERIIFE